MDTKSFLASKTFQGVIVMILSLLLPKLGLQLADADMQQLAVYVMQAASIAWIAIGRITASKRITITGKVNGPAKLGAAILALYIATGGLSACALKSAQSMTGPARARAVAYELLVTWQDAYSGYQSLLPTVPPDEQAKLKATIAPAIDRAKPAVLTLASAASIWSVTAEHNATAAQETQALAEDASALVNNVLTLLKQAGR